MKMLIFVKHRFVALADFVDFIALTDFTDYTDFITLTDFTALTDFITLTDFTDYTDKRIENEYLKINLNSS